MDDRPGYTLNTEDLDRELAAAIRLEPSADFRARVRARVAGEQIKAPWGVRLLPIVACAGLAGLLAAGAWWLNEPVPASAPLAQASVTMPAGALPFTEPAATESRQPSVAPRRALTRPVPRVSERPAVDARARTPEVLLSESEKAGVRLLFESAASGRLELPPEMLQDTTVPLALVPSGDDEGVMQ